MKIVFSYLIILIYLAHPIQMVGIYISFKSNQKFIARVLCINKDKPELKCNGKCHLKKEIKKATENGEKQKSTNIRFEEKIQISEDRTIIIKKVYTPYSPKYKSYNIQIPYFCLISDIFHPPQFV